MEKRVTTDKVIIQWFQENPDGTMGLQIRKYKDEKFANEFIEKLLQRGVCSCMKKTSQKITFLPKEN